MNNQNKVIYRGVVIVSIVAIILITCGICQNEREDRRGSKQLNSLISVAIQNGRKSDQFLTILPPNSLLEKAIPSSCSRQLYGIDLLNSGTFVGALARVYNSSTLRIGVSTQANSEQFSINGLGVVSGFLADVSRLVTNQMGMILGREIVPSFVSYHFNSYFEDTIDLINSGNVDTVVGVVFLTSRARSVDFTCVFADAYPLAIFTNSAVGLPPEVGVPSSIKDLNRAQIRVSIVKGSFSESVAERFFPLAKRVYFAKGDDAFNAVGRTTDIVCDDMNTVALYNAQNRNRLTLVEHTETLVVGGNAFITKKY